MKVIQSKRVIPFIVLITGILFLFFTAANYFLQERNVTGRVCSLLRKSLKTNGLTIDIGKVHWLGFEKIKASEIVFKDLQDGTPLFTAERIYLQFNLFSLINNHRHPEASLREIQVIKPQFTLIRFEDGSLNLSKYFSRRKRTLRFQMKLKVRNGLVNLEDYRYGSYVLQGVAGQVDLDNFPLLQWSLNGRSDFNQGMNWSSRGKFRIDQSAGVGEFRASRVSLNRLVPFIPYRSPYKIRSGSAELALKFAWNKEAIWLEQGKADISDAVVLVPRFETPFYLQNLEAIFSPQKLTVKKLRLVHERSVVKASGEINTDTTQIKATLSAEQLKLEDLTKLLPISDKLSGRGLVDLRLGVKGSFAEPVIDGELFVNNAQVLLEGRKTIEQLSGRMTIRRNNLQVERLEGTWNNSLIGIYGKVDNLLNPSMDLKIYGFGLNLQPEEVTRLSEYGLKTEGDINFLGEITGEPKAAKIGGEIIFDRIMYQEVPISGFKVKLEWDSCSESLKVLELDGQVWGGSLAAKGEIRINDQGVKWQVSGSLSGINIGETAFCSETGINGKGAVDLIFKGQWREGTPFQVGNIFGIFKGEQLTYQDVTLEEANGVFSWVDGNLIIDSLQARIGDGMVYGHLSWNPSALQLGLNAENVKIRQLLPDNNQYPLDGVFNGSFLFAGPPGEITGKINGVCSELSWAAKPIGTIGVTLDYGNQVLNIAECHIATESGDYVLGGHIDLKKDPVLSLNLTGDNVRLEGFLPWLPVNQSFTLNGDADLKLEIAGKLSNPSLHGEAKLTSPEIGPLSMDQGLIIIDGNINELVLTDFHLNRANSEIRISGKINREHLNLELRGTSLNLDTMQLQSGGRKLGGIIDFEGEITGTPGNPSLNAVISGANLSFGTFSFRQLAAKITWDARAIEIFDANLSQGDSRIDFYGRIYPSVPVRLDLEIKGTSLNLKEILGNLSVLPASLELDGKLSGFMKVNGTPDNPEVRITGNLSGGVINTLPVGGEFDLAYKNNKVTLRRVLLTQDTGTLLAEGVWETGKMLKLEIGLQDFSLGMLDSFFHSSYRLAGKANSFILLQWSNAGISGEYRLEVDDFQLNDSQLGVLKIRGDFYDQGLSVLEGNITRKGTNLTVHGYLPWPPKFLQWLKLPLVADAGSRNLDLSFLFKSFPADIAGAFIPNITVTNGVIDGEISLRGVLAEPSIYGKLEGSGINLNVEDLPCSVEGFQATMIFDGYKAEIQKAKGNYGKGKFNLSGSVAYQGLKLTGFDLGISGANMYYKNHYFDGYGDFNLKLSGNLTDAILSGNLKIYDCRIGILDLIPDKNEKPLTWNPALAIRLQTGRNVRYRQMGMADVDLDSSLQVQGRLREPELEGKAKSNKGILTLYGQTFRVTQGKAVFKYSEGYKPYIEVDSNLKTPQAVVFLTIKGQVGGNISINLTSQPFLPQSELFAMLNWSDLHGDKPFTVDGALLGNAGFVTDTLFGDVFFELRSALNLDILYLEPNYQQNDLRLNVGRYVTDEFFLSYSRSFSNLSNENWGLDYQLTPRLTLGGNFSLLEGTSWRLVYRFSF